MMIWDNVLKGNCPYCGSILVKEEERTDCTSCRFSIHNERLSEIIKNRKPKVRIRWQNLLAYKCPLCAFDLNTWKKEKIDNALYECLNSKCNFKIRSNSIDKIVTDQLIYAKKHQQQEEN